MANCELKRSKRGWFKSIFLGKKKKKNTKKHCDCCCCCSNPQGATRDQMVQTSYIVSGREVKLNACSDVMRMPQNGLCPGKNFSLERRGLGFHMYFCTNNEGNIHIARGNKTMICGKNKTKVINCCTDKGASYISETESLEGTKITTGSNRSPSPKSVKNRNLESRGKDSVISDIAGNSGLVSTPLTGHVGTPLTGHVGTPLTGHVGPPLTGHVGTPLTGHVGTPLTAKKSREALVKHPDPSAAHPEESKRPSILKTSKTSKLSVLNSPLITALLSSPRTILPNERRNEMLIDPTQLYLATDIDEDNVFKEYESLRRQKSRRSTMKSTRGLTRNSLMSLRKKRESSVFGNRLVPEILMKLDHIEEKLSELEKVYEDRGKNVTNIVGISCNSKKSGMAIEVGGLNDQNRKDSSSPCLHTIMRSLNVQADEKKPFGKAITIPVVPSRGSADNRRDSKQLIYHNTQELDAHNLTSKSSSKTKAVSQTKKSSEGSKDGRGLITRSKDSNKKQNSEMWRKISEELKI